MIDGPSRKVPQRFVGATGHFDSLMRYALYYTPEPGDPLLEAAEAWLGRSAFGRAVAGAEAGEAQTIGDARRYGFHATLKAPFELADGRCEGDLREALVAFAASRSTVHDIRLRLDQPSGFFAIVPDGPHPALDAFAADVVREFDAFRAPLSDGDRARRKPDTLSERQRRNLDSWGYPYVFEDFGFHLTLTGRLDERASAAVRPVLETRFAPLLAAPRTISSLALFGEGRRGADFEVLALHPLSDHARTPTALGQFDPA